MATRRSTNRRTAELQLEQKERQYEAKIAGFQDDLFLLSVHGEEGLGTMFRFELEMVSTDEDIDLEDLLEKSVTVTLKREGTDRYINGLIAECEYLGTRTHLVHYRLVIRPKLWFLSHTTDCRIFQEKSVPDIVTELANEHGLDLKKSLTGTYATREYCVQYRESRCAFICRLLEEEGIYFFFKHTDGKHEIVLADDITAHTVDLNKVYYLPPGSQEREEFISSWVVTRAMRSAKYEINDYDFEKPTTSLIKNHNTNEPGAHELYDYPGEYKEPDVGGRYAKIRLEENQSDNELTNGRCNHGEWAAGIRFKLSEHPRQDQNKNTREKRNSHERDAGGRVRGEDREYLVVYTQLSFSNGSYDSDSIDVAAHFEANFSVIDSGQAFRPQRRTPRPIVGGPQTAVVVGPSGEEIHTDKHGRVKLHFHWDRHDQKDQNSSCWIRVAQIWAGKRWGGIWIPRIDDEVIVDFLEGDPDRPIVTGRVYNGDNKPPYSLPDNKTQSGILTNSTKQGSKDTANELRFEDKKDEEEVYFHAEKDFNRVVENNDTLKVGFDKTDPGDQTTDIYNDRTTTLDQGNDKLQVKTGNRTIDIDKGNHDLTVKLGDHSVTIKAGKSTTSAMKSIELKVGPSTIKLTPSSIEVKSPMIKIQGTATAEMKSPMTTVSGDGMLTLKGGMVMIN